MFPIVRFAVVALGIALIWHGGSSAAFAQFGDTDGDGEVDNFDLMTILDNQGLAGAPGDIDADFDTDAGDYQLATFNFSLLTSSFGNSVTAPPAGVNSAKLIYNPTSGGLSLDQTGAPGGILSAFLLQSTSAFNVVNPVSYPFATAPQNLAMRDSSVLAQADPAAATTPPGMPASPHFLGNLLPLGLDLAGLNALAVRGVYTGQISGQPAGSHVQSFQIVVVPEPGALLLGVTAVAAVSAGRRRRA